jgi:hypothetical protein
MSNVHLTHFIQRKCQNIFYATLRGVVEDLSGLRDRGPGFKTRSRPLTFTKAVTEFQNPTRCGVLIH